MTGLIPAPRGEWTEAAGRRVVDARAMGGTDVRSCEVTWSTQDLQWSHRIAAGRGGTYAPSNGLLLAAETHAWAHGHPERAYALGWHVKTGFDPRQVPVWLARPFRGFFYLTDDLEPLVSAHPEDHPDLPSGEELALILPPSARGALA